MSVFTLKDYHGNYVTRPELSALPNFPQPFYLRSVGTERISPQQVYRAPGCEKPFVELFWGVAGVGEIWSNGEPLLLHPGDVCYQLPGEDHLNRALTEIWEFRWFTFDGPLAESFMLHYGYPQLIPEAGDCPLELFKELESGLLSLLPGTHRRMVAVIAEILALAGAEHHKPEEVVGVEGVARRFIEIVMESYTDPGCNVNSVAEQLGIHRSTLSKIFAERMGVTPGKYLAGIRLQSALSLLQRTTLPVKEIGRLVGIPDPVLFTKTIRLATGVSPSKYRLR